MNIKDVPRENDGSLPAYAWPGGYPVYYLDEENETLCAKCATNQEKNEQEGYVYYEGPPKNMIRGIKKGESIMPNVFKKYASRGGKYTYTLYRDEQGFTFHEHERSRLIGGGSFGSKCEAEVMEHVARYLSFYHVKMKEV